MSVPDDIRAMLQKAAERDQVPEATKAARLLELGLELEEDQMWDEIANRRDKKGNRFTSHMRAWK